MNLISNCCIGGYIYQLNKEELKNPFQWSFISGVDFLTLIKFYDTINFNNISLEKSIEFPDTFYIILDSRLKVNYIHYKYSNSETKISGHDVVSNDIQTFITDTYNRRLQRMQESPVFLYIDGVYKTDDNVTEEIAKTSCNKVLITYNKKLLSLNNDNSLIIYDDTKRMVLGKTFPINYAYKHYGKILDFIHHLP